MTSHFMSWHSYRDFEQAVKYSNRYIRSIETEKFLQTLLATSEEFKERIEPGIIFWRAQLGYKKNEAVHSDSVHFPHACSPYPPERMKPRYREAFAGRVNPKGIPCLYLATDQKTAISEVRPWIGSMVSAAQFKTHRELVVINFTEAKFDPYKYKNLEIISYEREPEPNVRKDIVWTEINEAFSRPVIPNDQVDDYVPTQIIAELFKDAGLDGIAYASSLGSGHNLAIFDIEALKIVNCFLCKVKKIDVDYYEPGNSYFIEDEEENKDE